MNACAACVSLLSASLQMPLTSFRYAFRAGSEVLVMKTLLRFDCCYKRVLRISLTSLRYWAYCQVSSSVACISCYIVIETNVPAFSLLLSACLRECLLPTSLRCWACCMICGALLSISTWTSSRRSPASLGETLVELCAELCMHWRHLDGGCPN